MRRWLPALALVLVGCAGAEPAWSPPPARIVEPRPAPEPEPAPPPAEAVPAADHGLAARELLAALYADLGRRRYAALEYRDAAVALRRALDLAPDDADSHRLLERTEWLLGERRSGPSLAIRCGPPHPTTVVQAELEHLLHEARARLEAGDVDGALARAERARESLRWFRFRLEGDLEAEVKAIVAAAWPPVEEWPPDAPR